MRAKIIHHERGQIIVLVALALVALIGMVALAVDGGIVYFDRRRAQTAADNAAIAGALMLLQGKTDAQINYFNAVGSSLNSKPFIIAAANGFDNNGTTNWVQVSAPPFSGYYAEVWDKDSYVQVHIRERSNTSLIQLIYPGLAEGQVDAVAHGTLPGPNFPGDAIVGLDPYSCKTVWFHGTQTITITGGNVYSNSNATSPPQPSSCGAGVQGGSGSVNITGGEFNIVGGFVQNGGAGTLSPYPNTGVQPEPYHPVPSPNCSDPTLNLPNYGDVQYSGHGAHEMHPGIYGKIKITGGTITMDPGLYCLNGDFQFSNTTISNSSSSDAGVLIYMASGSFSFTGGAIDLHGLNPVTGTVTNPPPTPPFYPSTDGTGQPYDYSHYLILAPSTNTSSMTIMGNTGTTYTGTILAPSSACSLGGSGSTIGYQAQIICDTVNVGGTAAVNITNSAQNSAALPAILDLVK